jgi:heme/copper-type cytochrome/quinol oxidase subunit 1
MECHFDKAGFAGLFCWVHHAPVTNFHASVNSSFTVEALRISLLSFCKNLT